ncbi:C1 family peptidase [Microvirga sp. 0TCS3.31]
MRLAHYFTLVTIALSGTSAFSQDVRPAFTPQLPTYEKDAKPPPGLTLADLAGTVVPPDLALQAQVQASVSQQVASDPEAQSLGARQVNYHEGCSPAASSFDWRAKNVISPVKDQRTCGSCYIFASTGALEASWMIQNTKRINASEQQVLDCANAGDCQGGFHTRVFAFMKSNGVADGAQVTYRNQSSGQCSIESGPYSAINWGMVDRNGAGASIRSIKENLCLHGPIVAALYATPEFSSYSGGVFNEFDEGRGQSDINHDVLIIGWNDAEDAWIIKNSWGTWWGEQGFGKIRYRSNYIGFGAAWVDAVKLPPATTASANSGASEEKAKAINERVLNDVLNSGVLGGPNSDARKVFDALRRGGIKF